MKCKNYSICPRALCRLYTANNGQFFLIEILFQETNWHIYCVGESKITLFLYLERVNFVESKQESYCQSIKIKLF